MAIAHNNRFPGESPEYRTARGALLEAELALQKQIQAVAEQRRHLPLGGEAQDYVFARESVPGGAAQPVRLSELFAPAKDTLLLYSYMFSPQMKQPCPMCTSFLDGLNGNAQHIERRVNLAVAAKSPIQRIGEFARGRGWSNLKLLSSSGTTYNQDYYGESEEGGQIPMMTVFTRRNGKIHHFYSSEAVFVPEEGHDTCHIDMMWPLWNALDLTPEGRGDEFYPSLNYKS
jgi:predicted dithiol-disulfide oxidoreductase (DUF899 family)